MSRFNEYTIIMEQTLDYWYQLLPFHTLQQMYGTDDITNDLQKSWYKLTYHQKNKIYETRIY